MKKSDMWTYCLRSSLACVLVLLANGNIEAVTVDFETPSLGAADRQVISPYIDSTKASRENNLINSSGCGLKRVCMSHPQYGRSNHDTDLSLR